MPRLLNTFAASRILGINSDDLRRLAESGEIPHVRLPGRFDDPLRFEEADLWNFARAHRQPVRETIPA
jgi:Helix-turn-helix domain